MRLRQLQLKHFCQHADRVINFPVGVTGIIGANGTGKSNIVKGLRFALLGDSGNDGSKADDMNWEAPADAKGGSVKLLFESGGVDGDVSRSITQARASMKHGDRHEKSVNSVNPAILELLGLPKKTVQDVIFVLQGDIEAILFEEPAERKKRFQGLFGIDKAEPMRVVLQRELAEIGEPPSDERLKELQTTLDSAIDPQLRQLRERQEQLKEQVKGLDDETLSAIIETVNKRQSISTQLTELTAEIEQRQAQANELAERLQQDIDAAKVRDAEASEIRQQIETLRDEVSTLKSKRSMGEAIKRWEADKVRCQKALETTPPVQPTTVEAIDQARADVNEVRAELAPKKAFVNTFERSVGTPLCPTCGQPVPNAGDHAAQLKVEIQTVEQQLAAVTEAIASSERDYQQYLNAKATYDALVKSSKDRLAEIDEQLKCTGDLSAVCGNEARLAEVQAQLAQLLGREEALRQESTKMSSLHTAAATLRGALDTFTKQRDTLATQLAELPELSDADKQAAEAHRAALTAARTESANIEGQIAQLQSNRATLVLEIDTLKTQISRADGLKQYRQYCERARTLFHHDCLPLLVTQAYLSGLNAKLNEYLRTFSMPFQCMIRDDLSVTCIIGNGVERSAARLSGGQKVALSIAFRFAVYSLFASTAGFMVLDEPTAYLDNDRIAAVVELLQQVRQYAHSAGMQLIIPTHEPALMEACDATIELS